VSVDPRPAPPVHPSQRPVELKGLRTLLGLGENRYLDTPPSVQWGMALERSGKNTYAGTVPHAEVQRRRAANRRARASRRINRGRS
jgi:hypothetical protein